MGRQFFDNQLVAVKSETNDSYDFQLTNTAFLDAQIVQLTADVSATLHVVKNSVPSQQFSTSINTGISTEDGSLHISAPAGTSFWEATVDQNPFARQGLEYSLALAADRAPGSLFSGTLDFRGDQGLELGSLSTVTPKTARDFIGYLDTSAHAAKDNVDTYFFSVPTFGTVDVRLSGLANDAAGGAVAADVRLFQDVDGDGRLEPSETIDSKSASVGNAGDINRQLAAGHYAVVVSRLQPSSGVLLGGSNYNLTVSYSVTDGAGNSLATATPLDLTFINPKTITDYLSGNDTLDFYQFSATGGGPFLFDATLTHTGATNMAADIALLDGSGHQLALSTLSSVGSQSISANSVASGTFFVRVRRVSGEGTYSMTLGVRNTDVAGNTLGTALNLGNVQGQIIESDSVSSNDLSDIYKFTLTLASTVRASFPATATGTNANLFLIQDKNGNGAIDDGDNLASSTNPFSTGESLTQRLAAGTYFVGVFRLAETPTYHLALSADTAGSDPRTSRAMGLAGTTSVTTEFIDPNDPVDIFQVDINTAVQLNIFLANLDAKLLVTVAHDSNGDGKLESEESLLERTIVSESARLTLNLNAIGKIFIKVAPVGTAGTNYLIRLATAPREFAGNTPATARDAGVLGSVSNILDFVGNGSIAATNDEDDFYRFTLGNNGPFTFTATISNLTGDANLELFLDANGNRRVDDDNVLASSRNTGTSNDTILTTLDQPGTYYLHVFRASGNASYSLSMSAVSQDTAGNTPDLARILGNLTTSTPLSANEFVGPIDPDDFFQFTVSAPAILSVSLHSGSRIPVVVGVEVIQDADFDFVIDPGETLATTTTGRFAGISGISLPAAGNYFVHILSVGFPEDYGLGLGLSNPPVGTFALTPIPNPIPTVERTKLALAWTVPEGSWHSLQDIEVRLGNILGTIALIKFNEADNTVSLFHFNSGKYGPAKALGSAAVLSNQFVKIFLKTSRVSSANPTSPTVILTFDIEFKNSVAGRDLIVEAAASDDLGHVQDFAIAGMLEIQDRRHR